MTKECYCSEWKKRQNPDWINKSKFNGSCLFFYSGRDGICLQMGNSVFLQLKLLIQWQTSQKYVLKSIMLSIIVFVSENFDKTMEFSSLCFVKRWKLCSSLANPDNSIINILLLKCAHFFLSLLFSFSLSLFLLFFGPKNISSEVMTFWCQGVR